LLFFVNTDIVFAESDSIDIKLIVFENTSIIEFTNNGIEPINIIKLWLIDDSFLSFKTEFGWTGEKNNQGTLIFSPSTPFESDQKVKFGIKTSESNSPINWNAVGVNGTSIEINTTQSLTDRSILDKNFITTGFLDNSKFKTIPESPRTASPIRITGTDFMANQQFTLFMNGVLIDSFETDDVGSFIFTETIPDTFEPGIITYGIRDLYGNEILRDGHLLESVESYLTKASLTVDDISVSYSIGDVVSFSGKTEPESYVSIIMSDPSDSLWSKVNTISDISGNWFLDFKITQKSFFGTYTAEIKSLDSFITKQLNVLLSKQINVSSMKPSFSKNDIISFNGSGNPGDLIRVFVLNSNGIQENSFEYIIPENGLIKIEYDYASFISDKTYFLYIFQGNTVDIIPFGIDKHPKKILSSKLNKINYLYDDVAFVAIHGESLDELLLIISDDSGNSVLEEKIILGPEGKSTYQIDLTNLNSDYYFIIISKGTMKTTENFTVGFPVGFHFVDYSFTKKFYHPHDLVSLYGYTSPKIPMNFTLYDSKSNIIDKTESFSNDNGNFIIDNFKIPTIPNSGEWMINIQSGTNSKNIFFNVDSDKFFVVEISEIQKTPYGKLVLITGKNASPENPVSVTISNKNSTEIWEMPTTSTNDGDFSVLWPVPKDAPSGEYLVESRDFDSKYSSVFFEI